MFLLIDSYDSFTFNLYQFLLELGTEVLVRRNDTLDAQEALALGTSGIVLSPGPCRPEDAGILLPLVRAAAAAHRPLLGVCLGHQAVAAAFGARVIRANRLVHGKTSAVRHDGSGLFRALPSPLEATRYHSLLVERSSLPSTLRITAETAGGTIMGLAHESLPIWGVQFHPESIATEAGHELLGNFVSLAVAAGSPARAAA